MDSLPSGLDKGFVNRVIYLSAIAVVTLGTIFVAAGKWLPSRFGWGFLFGGVCGTLNLFFLKSAIESLTGKDRRNVPAGIFSLGAIQGIIVGFLYAIYIGKLHAVGLAAGFSVFLAVIVVKAAASAFNPKGE